MKSSFNQKIALKHFNMESLCQNSSYQTIPKDNKFRVPKMYKNEITIETSVGLKVNRSYLIDLNNCYFMAPGNSQKIQQAQNLPQMFLNHQIHSS